MNTNTMTAEQVLSEVGYEGFVEKMFNWSEDRAKDFAHAVLGVATEIKELRDATDPTNAVEEGGDAWFYATAVKLVVQKVVPEDVLNAEIYRILDTDSPELGRVGTRSQYIDKRVNDLLDHAKRWVGYGKLPACGLVQVMMDVMLLINASLEDCGVDTSQFDLELVNVKKLLKRYNGMAFNAELATNRDLPAERKVLEDAVAAA